MGAVLFILFVASVKFYGREPWNKDEALTISVLMMLAVVGSYFDYRFLWNWV